MENPLLEQLTSTLPLSNQGLQGTVLIFLVVTGTALASFLAKRMLQVLMRRVGQTKTLWDDAFFEAGQAPLTLLIWLLGLAWSADLARDYSGAEIFAANELLLKVGVICDLGWFLVRLISNGEKLLIQGRPGKEPVDETTAAAIGKLLRASVLITASLVMLQTLGFSISGVLAFGGIGGIAVGFAAKDLLANFFGGLMIYLDRPFKVGDWVRSPDKNIEGTVEYIGWRLTTVRTFDKRPLYVPNSTFTSISVENPSRMSHRRIYETIGVRYADASKLTDIIRDVRAMLMEHSGIDSGQTTIVNFNSFGPSSLDFFVYCFTVTTNWIEYHEVKQDVLLKIYRIIADLGAEIAFPTQTLHVADALRLAGVDGESITYTVRPNAS